MQTPSRGPYPMAESTSPTASSISSGSEQIPPSARHSSRDAHTSRPQGCVHRSARGQGSCAVTTATSPRSTQSVVAAQACSVWGPGMGTQCPRLKQCAQNQSLAPHAAESVTAESQLQKRSSGPGSRQVLRSSKGTTTQPLRLSRHVVGGAHACGKMQVARGVTAPSHTPQAGGTRSRAGSTLRYTRGGLAGDAGPYSETHPRPTSWLTSTSPRLSVVLDSNARTDRSAGLATFKTQSTKPVVIACRTSVQRPAAVSHRPVRNRSAQSALRSQG
mmetsp:Transcript_35869/g.100915  ORF Transcript_35869/g.100915 Transcript_35869/m.100915 type:complete len:274 (-) Transcript_35869:2454-3275(-)